MLHQVIHDTEPRSAQYYLMKVKTIEHHWKIVQQLHEQLWTAANDDYDLDEFLLQETEINEQIFNYNERFNSAESNMKKDDQSMSRKSDVRLPKIELPNFDGNYLKWRQYRDLFIEMVHNQELSGCQKLWYLKSSLAGEAARLIQHFTTTSENYTSAWQIINNRYENKRLLVGALLQRVLSQPTIQKDSPSSIKSLHDTTLECLLGLQALGIPTDDWDPLIVHILTQLIDRHTHMLWEQSLINPRELPKLQEFIRFLELRFQSLEAVGPSKRNPISSSSTLVTAIDQCIACKQVHGLYQCHKFKAMTSKQRLQLVQYARNCVNCLRADHKTNQCTSTKNCQRCGKRHNTMLHLDTVTSNNKQNYNPMKSVNNATTDHSASASSLVVASHKEKTAVLLSTVLLKIEDAYGKQIECRAILDNGSQVHLITQNLANKLGMQGSTHRLRIQGVGETHRDSQKRINVRLSSRVTSFNARVEALILPKIVSQQPRQYIQTQQWNIPRNISLADPKFNVPGDIDMLIGAGLFYSLLSVGQIKLGEKMPTLQNTVLGWIVGGEHLLQANFETVTCGMCAEEDLFSSMEKFWELEECPTPLHQMTAAELRCEQHFATQYKRNSDGRYIVKLPFQENCNALGHSYEIARQRLNSVEKRLAKNETLRQEYVNFMQEYLRLGHMQEISMREINGPHYFLPHHAVIKPDSTTTKVRVVFDGSAKTSTNIALNDLLATGPTIQDDVFTQLLRFRYPRFVFTADIEKMYRQILIHNDDRKFQLILWRDEPDKPVKCFQLNTVTYGTSCAPFLAIRCLRQLAEDGKMKYPLAAHIINKNFYVDDVLAGADEIKTAVEQVHQLQELLSSAGFNLRKWCSNDQRILRHIPEKEQEISLELKPSGCESVKTIGLVWTPREDSFSLRAEIVQHTRVTKRTALTEISKIFDPLGFIAPVTIKAKIFLQTLWRLRLDWDAALPQDLDTEWRNFRSEFNQLNLIKVSRHIFGHDKPRNMQIHIFADASEKAYGAVAYVRSITHNNSVIIRFLCAKSKVAPTKQTTLPRLELCAAKLATDLLQRIYTDLNIDKGQCHLWSDSTAVLGWIKAESSHYHTFVANRIASIQRITTSQQWHHVTSLDNPADIMSRGLNPSQLVENNFWYYGPQFLHARTDIWTNSNQTFIDCELEKREKARVSMTAIKSDDNTIFSINHHNSFRRLQRIIAYLLRCRKPRTPGFQLLGKANLVVRPKEMEISLQYIVKHIQRAEFLNHIRDIEQHRAVQHKSSVAHLSPFLDEMGILRVGGRLESADISYDSKHPMLLSHKHPLTKLLLTDLHKENMHAGVQTLLSISRQKFWIINGKTLARNIVHNCIRCTRAKPKLAEQIMGQLPKDRVTATRPFLITGVDFFGPIYVHFKLRGKHPQKVYVSVFCCFSTKAIHLEIVSDLSTEAFIGALKRFVGRRGRCQKIYCDNATNFTGARNLLKEIIHTEKAQTQILDMCSRNNIEFCFIPPRAPHFGGLWEAAVKSAKNLLQTTLSAASLTYEEMETVIIEAEAILNSRPLTQLSTDPNDMTALTPGHFLIGEPLTAVADPHIATTNISCQKRWNLVRHLKNEFWRRWSLEYLNELQHRYKWHKECQNIKKGTMVIIKDDNLPPLKWALGRIEKVIPGLDGLVRVADVRTAHNIMRRPIHRLAPLPIEENTVSNQLPEEIVAETTPTRANPTRNTRKRKFASSIVSLLLTCLIPLATPSSVNFTPFQGDPGIYYERIGMVNTISSSWSLVNFIDLRPLWQEAEITEKYGTVLAGFCNMFEVTTTCQKTVHQLQHQLNIIDINNQLLKHNRRSKRGALNFIGNVANGLFGVLDSEYAEKVSRTIENLRANDESLKQHMENQTLFLDRTLAIMRKNQEEVKKEFLAIEEISQKFSSQLNNISHQMQLQQLATTFNEAALQAFMQITRFRSIQDAIVDIITDAHHGKLSPELLSPKELQTELQTIDSQNTRNTKLPFALNNITQYYQIMTISHQITANYVIFNVQLPLIMPKELELLRLIPIPWCVNNTFYKLKTSTTYLIVDLLRELHFPLTSEELQKCIVLDNTLFFCHQTEPLYNHNSPNTQCELSILRESKITSYCHKTGAGNVSHWRSLNTPNSWIYSVGPQELINIVCDNIPSQIKLSGSGIMKIEDGCRIKTTHVTIEGHATFTQIRQVAYTPIKNISNMQLNQEFEEYNYSSSYHDSYAEIGTLQDDLSKFKIISLNNIRPHDVHHYGLGYTLLILVVLCASCVAALYCKQRRILTPTLPQPAPRPSVIQKKMEDDRESQIFTMFNS